MPKKDKKLLIISPLYPFPQRCGFSYRVADMCKYLSKYFQVHILITDSIPSFSNLPCLNLFEKVYIPERKNNNKYFLEIFQKIQRRLFQPQFDHNFYINPSVLTLLRYIFHLHNYPAVIINTPMLGYCLKAIPDNAIKILDTHDIWHLKYLNFQSIGYGKLLSHFKDKEKELNLYRSVNSTLAISVTDLEYLNVNNVRNTLYVPPSFQLSPIKNRINNSRILLYASGQGPLNIDAIEFFINQILPIVREKIPNVRLKVLNPEKSLLLKYQNHREIIFSSYTDDIKKEYESSELVVVPLRFANGIKIKVLESFAFGMPTIVSPPAIAGIESSFFQQKNISLDHKIMASEVIEALTNENYKIKLSNSGLRIISECYNSDKVYSKLMEKLNTAFR